MLRVSSGGQAKTGLWAVALVPARAGPSGLDTLLGH